MNFSDWILTNGDNIQVSIFFSLLVLLAVAERLFPKRQGSTDRPRRWTANLLLTFLNFAALGVIPTPDLHRIHHSVHEPETNSNYGAVFPVWDLSLRDPA